MKITYFVNVTTENDELGLSSGWTNESISGIGKLDAQKLRSTIDVNLFDYIFCSDLKKSRETCDIVFEGKNIIEDKRLRECNYGVFDGKDKRLVKYMEHINTPFMQGESLKQVETRVKEFILELKENYNKKKIAIVGGDSLRLAIEVICNKKTWVKAIEDNLKNTVDSKVGCEYKL